MRRHLARFNASSVRMPLADRDFVGQEWFAFLKEKDIPFCIRLKEEQIIRTGGREMNLRPWLSRCRGLRGFTAVLPRKAGAPDIALRFGARRIKGGELLIVASSVPLGGERVLRYCSKRARRCRSNRWRTTASPSNACSPTARRGG